MGTKVFFFQGYHRSMRDLNEDSSSWSLCYGDDNLITNGQRYYNGIVSSYPVRDIDALKRKMIEHEAIFRSQLYELHRLYRIQKNAMEETKRNTLQRLRVSTEPSSSSSLRVYLSPLFDSGYGRTSASGVGFRDFPASCTEEYHHPDLTQLPISNRFTLKENESLDSRPSKARKNLFDLQIPPDEYTDTEEMEDNNIELVDLNEPIQIKEGIVISSSNSVDRILQASSVEGRVPFGESRKIDNSSGLNPSLAWESTTRNGFYHGETGEHCHSPLYGFSYNNFRTVGDLCHEDKKHTMGIDLNEVVDLTIMDDKKDEGEASTWLKHTNPIEGNDDVNSEQRTMIDINLKYEPDDDEPTLEKQNQANVGAFRNQIDLNSCVSDIDDSYVASFGSYVTTVNRIFEIDLEAPPSLRESEDDVAAPFKEIKNKPMQDECLQNAAEIIFSMSSLCPQTQVEDNINQQPSETSLSESLLWLVDIVSSYANKLENTNKESCKEIDDFEAMTLQLQGMKEQNYLCRPFIPEIQEIKETGTKISLLTRSRRGHSRRGRRRKDFQRDILPSLATLSRHEVTKDLRTFS